MLSPPNLAPVSLTPLNVQPQFQAQPQFPRLPPPMTVFVDEEHEEQEEQDEEDLPDASEIGYYLYEHQRLDPQ